MYRILKSILVLALLSIMVSPTFAQTDSSVVYVRVDYMKVAPGKTAAYVDMDQKIWKPIHEARMKAGIIASWSLYSVEYPYGTSAEYSHATVNIYDDFNKMKEEYPSSAIQAGHPKAGQAQIDEMMAKTIAARELVRSELWVLVESVPTDKPAAYLQVNYMKVAPFNGDEYLKMEREIWKPIHQAAKAAGYEAGWGVYSLMFPGGSQIPYNFGTVDFYDEFSDLAASTPQNVLQKAHPDATEEKWNAMWNRTMAAREVVRQELWVLLDQIDASTIAKAGK